MTRFVVEMQFDHDNDRLAGLRPAHRRYWEDLAERGILLGGGLFADECGGLLLCELPDESSLRRVVNDDPYVRNGVVTHTTIREWALIVGVSGAAGADDGIDPASLGLTMVTSAPKVSLVQRIEQGARLVRDRQPASLPSLTAHEERIAHLMLAGRTNREIAAQFRVSARAVELHITNMYRKLGIRRRAQLASAFLP